VKYAVFLTYASMARSKEDSRLDKFLSVLESVAFAIELQVIALDWSTFTVGKPIQFISGANNRL